MSCLPSYCTLFILSQTAALHSSGTDCNTAVRSINQADTVFLCSFGSCMYCMLSTVYMMAMVSFVPLLIYCMVDQ